MADHYTQADLLAIWLSAVDDLYSQPFIEAGDGNGLEAYSQAFAQLERVSEAINTSVQAMYVLPHSSQTDLPADGEACATVALTVTRTLTPHLPLYLGAGVFWVGEQTTDATREGPITIDTGRLYGLTAGAYLFPGCVGPVVVDAAAEQPGHSYNNPEVGSLVAIQQPGALQTATGASVVVSFGTADKLVVPSYFAVLLVGHVGQYIQFTAGSNADAIRRVVDYTPPVDSSNGGVLVLARDVSLLVGAGVAYTVGETVDELTTGATGILLGYDTTTGEALVQLLTPTYPLGLGGYLEGRTSGAGSPVTRADYSPLVVEAGTASWRVLGWAGDFGITTTNAASPTGGRLGYLDEFGKEKNLPRGNGETSDAYRTRITTLNDVVTPNAIKRACARFYSPLGLVARFLEPSTIDSPAFYYDVPPSCAPAGAFAYDMDPASVLCGKWRVYCDYEMFRAYFMIEVPVTWMGDPGWAYDGHPRGAYDTGPVENYYDGVPAITRQLLTGLWNDLNARRAAGVGFGLYMP